MPALSLHIVSSVKHFTIQKIVSKNLQTKSITELFLIFLFIHICFLIVLHFVFSLNFLLFLPYLSDG